ncbi:ewing's tumor-associated antigen 1 homolog isoform X1 [Mobula hypostoma]|uniref:ewing's tumor-associated antigen 1 homolog isoform X1 n=1 Tax=Mobula hypostoma TaxID=723540 RepID=UPI002FC2B3B9
MVHTLPSTAFPLLPWFLTCTKPPAPSLLDFLLPNWFNRFLALVVQSQHGLTLPIPGPSSNPSEVLSYKTPKRIFRKQQFTANQESPVNDSELQQDIYWDQHSPTTFKLGNGKKSSGTCPHVVEISDIVNRIAPQQSSEVPLNIWLGEDAIQCSPAVSFRERIKTNNSRFQRSTEEELMKLAKEFDRNMVEQDISYGQEISELNEILDDGNSEQTICTKQANCDISALEKVPETKITEQVEHDGKRTLPLLMLHSQSSSQKSLDLEAEAAVNALFDGPTQYTNLPLSQGFSGDDGSSPKLNDCHSAEAASTPAKGNTDHDRSTNITSIGEQVVSFSTAFKQKTIPHVSSLVELNPDNSKHDKKLVYEDSTTDFNLHQQETIDVQSKGKTAAVCSFESAPDNGFDDWTNDDWMEDDSLILQISQIPELIDSPTECTHFANQSLDTAGQKVTKEFKDASEPKDNSDVVPSVSFMQSSISKSNNKEFVTKTLQFGEKSERAKPRFTFTLQNKANYKISEEQSFKISQPDKDFKRAINTVKKKEQKNSDFSTPQHDSNLSNVPIRELTSLTCARSFKQENGYDGSTQKKTEHSLVLQKLASTENSELNLVSMLTSERPCGAGTEKGSDIEMQSTFSEFVLDDWNDAEFYSEIQNAFSESDVLWETGDDDDDLNRMCDDVEKLIENQNSQVTLHTGMIELKVANGNQSLTSKNMHQNQCTNQLNGQQKHLNQNQPSKQNVLPSLRAQPRPTDLICTVCTITTSSTQSHHLNSVSNFQSKSLSNISKMCALNVNRIAPGSGSRNTVDASNLPGSADFGTGQKIYTSTVTTGHPVPKSCGIAGLTRTPRFTFSKITNSSVIGVQGNTSSHATQYAFGNRDRVKSSMERCVQSSEITATIQYPTASLKRHFSDSTLELKVGEMVEKPVAKCSQQEIEKKKQAALARRKMKMQASCTHPSTV